MGIWGYSLLFAAISGVLAFIFELFDENREPFWNGITTFIWVFILDFLLIYTLMPPFVHILWGGYPLLLFLNLFLMAVVVPAGIGEDSWGDATLVYREGPALASWTIFLACIVAWFVAMVVTPPTICDNATCDQLAALLQVEDATQPYPNNDPGRLIRVSPANALKKADEVLGDYGSYLDVNTAHLQEVGGHWYHIVDLKVTDWMGFRARGKVIPGYVAVDAMDPNVDAQFRTGYHMKYVPSARFNADLRRYVYMHYLLDDSLQIDDLESLEVDDHWNPYYTATLLRYEIGVTGREVESVLVFDPQTGNAVRYPKTDTPGWIDRIWSKKLVEEYADWWGKYTFWDTCKWQGKAGQLVVDQVNDVVTSEGLVFQVTLAPAGNSQSLTDMIYVNPRTGRAVRYSRDLDHEIIGRTLAAVDDLIDSATRSETSIGYEPVECELQRILSRPVWYCILNGRSADGETSDGTYAGAAFVQMTHTESKPHVIFDDSERALEVAYRDLERQIASERKDDPNIGQEVSDIQFEGVVLRKGVSGDGLYIHFAVKGENGVVKLFSADSNYDGAIMLEKWDRIIVTANEPLDGSDRLAVKSIENLTAPYLNTSNSIADVVKGLWQAVFK